MIVYLGSLCACSAEPVPAPTPKGPLSSSQARGIEQMIQERLASVRGNDDRKDYFELQGPDRDRVGERFLSVLANVKAPQYTDGGIKTHLSPLTDYLCAGQSFARQGRMASCSAVLIEGNRVLTSSHCIGDLEQRRFVGGFFLADRNRNHEVIVLPDRNICTPKGEAKVLGNIAIIEVSCHENAPMQPAPVATTAPKRGDSVYAIGFPQGLPAKYTDVERITEIAGGEYTVPLDLAGGNSGSPVFNSNHEIVGIVERDKSASIVVDHSHRDNHTDFSRCECHKWNVVEGNSSETAHITAIPELLMIIENDKKAI